ncbi:MAG TPA: lipoprotein signal peptidase [Hanamia sp.]|nr:lipoprotein signal peptidase [Hanamia sp.]
MKKRNAFLIIFLIVIADQVLKIYVKTHYHPGESHPVLGNWFRLYFIENEGMAYGWKLGGGLGKIVLTLFRLAAVIFGVFYLNRIIKRKYHPGYIICVSLVFAGALGNLLDSMFYGLIFDNNSFDTYAVATLFPKKGYAGFLHGNVVDMLYLPLVHVDKVANWVPFWGGRPFSFFNYIFNIADASVSLGVICILVFKKHFFKLKTKYPANENNNSIGE